MKLPATDFFLPQGTLANNASHAEQLRRDRQAKLLKMSLQDQKFLSPNLLLHW